MPPKDSKQGILARTRIAEARKNQPSALIGRYVTKEEYDESIRLGLRWCRTCKKFLPPHEFYGKDPRCIECTKEQQRKRRADRLPSQKELDNITLKFWREDNPEKTQKYRLSRYGKTQEWFNAKLLEQHNCCAVCGKKNFNIRGPFIDHNHKTDEIRGLLCARCNIFIGMLEAGLLDSALTYLKQYQV